MAARDLDAVVLTTRSHDLRVAVAARRVRRCVARVDVTGNVTQDQVAINADPLRELLGSDVYSRTVLLNMKGAPFLDSSGVSWLLITHKRFKDNSGRFILHSIPTVVLNVLKVLRMHLVFEIAESETDAANMLEGEAS